MKPILFNVEMMNSILNGDKTVAIIVIKDAPVGDYKPYQMDGVGIWEFVKHGNARTYDIKNSYLPGDILYVREKWEPYYLTEDPSRVHGYLYYAESIAERDKRVREETKNGCQWSNWEWDSIWHPSTHMPKEAARIFLRILDSEIKRIQDIDASDLSACCMGNEQDEFQNRWDKSIKPADREKYSYQANPWVWVVRFEMINKREERNG